jgi:hypothetical protein
MRNRRIRPAGPASAPLRSLHRKIQVSVEELRKVRRARRDDLVKQIHDGGHHEFTCFRLDSEKGQYRQAPCSDESVRAVIDICVDLELFQEAEGTGVIQLTPKGLKASDREQFETTMRPLLKAALNGLGTPMTRIEEVIHALLIRARDEALPTVENILAEFPDVKEPAKFRKYLNLFASCRGIATSRKRIFLRG